MSGAKLLLASRRSIEAITRPDHLQELTYEDTIVARAAQHSGMPYFDVRRLGARPAQPAASEEAVDISHCPPQGVEEFTAAKVAGGRKLSFDDLVSPLSAESFFQAQYPRPRPMLFRGPRDRFAHIIDWGDLDVILRAGGVDNVARYGTTEQRMRLVVKGNDIASKLVKEEHGRGQTVDERKLRSFARHGATLVMDRVQQIHPPVAELAHALETAMHSYASVNLYVSWRPTRGLDTHWDDHDVFVAQVCGRKRWRIFAPTRAWPTHKDVDHRREPPTTPLWEGHLTPGDLFFIPRGWWHDAEVDAAPGEAPGSIHLTSQTVTATGTSLMRWLENKLIKHELFRRDLPLMAGEAALEEYLADFRALLAAQLERCTAKAVKSDYANRWRDRATARLGPWIDPWQNPAWDRCSLSLLGYEHAALSEQADCARLSANGWVHRFDLRATGLLRPLLERQETLVADLKAIDPKAYPPDFVDGFLMTLVKKAIVVAREPSSAC